MQYKQETRCIHGDGTDVRNHPFGAVSAPIFQSATFAHPGVGKSTGYDYTRVSNPTRDELEHVLSSLEECADTIAATTGMAAISLVFSLFSRGDHIICSEDLYGGSIRFFKELSNSVGLTFTYVNTADVEAVTAALTDQTRALFLETPSNPTMEVTDLRAMRALADAHHLMMIVDNTFLTPFFQKPIRMGADLVVHSGTKYLSGHNDTLAGFVCIKDLEIAQKLRFHYKTVGMCLSPFDSFLVLRGIKTLALRMERAQENAKRIAVWLKKHPKVKQVYYVGLKDAPGHDINNKQAGGSGAMISLRVDSEKTARQILERVKLFLYAESLGGTESLITYPMLQTHEDVPVEIREKLGITEDFLRISVGIEHVEDLIEDLRQALA